jgi:hypothetical protein
MTSVEIAAWTYLAGTGLVVAFQLALAAGAPWGAYAMGGAFPGILPVGMRLAAVVQAAVLSFLAAIVLTSAGAAPPGLAGLPPWTIWIAVGVAGLALLLNVITRSAGERRIWAPVAAVMLASSLWVAFASR